MWIPGDTIASHCYEDFCGPFEPRLRQTWWYRKRQKKIKNVDQYGKHASRLVERDPFTQCLALFSCRKVSCCPRSRSTLCTYEPGLKAIQSRYLTLRRGEWYIHCRRSVAIGNDRCTLWSTFAHLVSSRASSAGETKLWVPLQRKDNGQSGCRALGPESPPRWLPRSTSFSQVQPLTAASCVALPSVPRLCLYPKNYLPAGRIAIHMYVIWRSKPRDTAGFGRTMVWLELPGRVQRDVLQVSVTKLSRSIYGKKIDLRCEFEIYHSGKYKVCGRRAHNRLIPFSHGYGHWLVPHLQQARRMLPFLSFSTELLSFSKDGGNIYCSFQCQFGAGPSNYHLRPCSSLVQDTDECPEDTEEGECFEEELAYDEDGQINNIEAVSKTNWAGRGSAGIRAWAAEIPFGAHPEAQESVSISFDDSSDTSASSSTSSTSSIYRAPNLVRPIRPLPPSLTMTKPELSTTTPPRPILNFQQHPAALTHSPGSTTRTVTTEDSLPTPASTHALPFSPFPGRPFPSISDARASDLAACTRLISSQLPSRSPPSPEVHDCHVGLSREMPITPRILSSPRSSLGKHDLSPPFWVTTSMALQVTKPRTIARKEPNFIGLSQVHPFHRHIVA